MYKFDSSGGGRGMNLGAYKYMTAVYSMIQGNC